MTENRYTRYATREYVDNIKPYSVIKDESTGYNYAIKIVNGKLLTDLLCSHIECEEESVTFYEGSEIDLSNLVFNKIYPNGSIEVIDNKDIMYEVEIVRMDTSEVIVTYIECGQEYSIVIPVTVLPFDPAAVLIDFGYTDNGDGTYTVTSWNQTLNGEPSTEFVLPYNIHVIL